jgi:hypothetical protein
VNATATEALTVARRILETQIGAAFNGINVNRDGAVTIGVADADVLARAGVNLRLEHRSSFVDQWCGVVDDIHISLRLAIPIGPFGALPARAERGAA